MERSGQSVLIGDVSWGDGCGDVSRVHNTVQILIVSTYSVLIIATVLMVQAGSYGVYGNISHLRPWLEDNMAGKHGLKAAVFCHGGPDAANVS